MIKAIETEYNGYKFRSRLEARWAVFFDEMGIKYLYEPEGIEVNGLRYLPDFYLPESNQFFEVKGIMSTKDESKIKALISSGYSVSVGNPDMTFNACNNWHENIYSLARESDSWLCKCSKCEKYWFMGMEGSYVCQCCGTYEGDHHFCVELFGNAEPHPLCGFKAKMAITKAKQARFECWDKQESEEKEPNTMITMPELCIKLNNRIGEAAHNRHKSMVKQFISELSGRDYSAGGDLDLCNLAVVKAELLPWLKSHDDNYDYGAKDVQDHFRNERYKIILDYKSKGYPPEEVVKRTRFSSSMIYKVYQNPETAIYLIKEEES